MPREQPAGDAGHMGGMNTLGTVHLTIAAENLPPIDPAHARAAWMAGLDADQILDNHRHEISGGDTLEAPHHARLAARRDGEWQRIGCACGAYAIALRFSRDEQRGWHQQHDENVSRHRACAVA